MPIIGYTPIISRMMKEWYSFHFQKQEDLERVLVKPWVYGRSFLSLSRWYMGFDPLKNTPSHSLIWLKLPNLPLELWTQESLESIGNAIGKFIYVDPWIRGEKDKRIAWILIERPYKGGYPEQLEIIWEGTRTHQRIDFWGIPFRCSTCHCTGHLQNACKYRRSRALRSIKTKAPSDSDSLSGRHFSFMSSDHANKGESPNLAEFKSPPLSPPLMNMADFTCPPIPEQPEENSVPSPPPLNVADFVVGSHPIQISSSPPSPSTKEHPSSTPFNSPVSSPHNEPDIDIDQLLNRHPPILEPLTIHKPDFPSIKPASAKNITVRKKTRGGSRHFRGRSIATDIGVINLPLVDVPIFESPPPQPLRASVAGSSSK